MSKLDEVRRSVGEKVGSLTPANARSMARDLLEPGAAKERVDKVTADLLEWSHRNGERLREMVRREIADQLSKAGLASKSDLDALTARVRKLERAGKPAAPKRTTTKTPSTRSSSKDPGAAKKG